MDTGTLVAVAVALVVLLVPVALIVRMPQAERRARVGLVRADVALRRARAAHASLVRTAERGVRSAEQQHSSQLAELDQRIVALEDPRGVQLDALGPVALHALRIVTPAGEVALDGVEATVDSAGALRERRRRTFTRLAVGAATFGTVGAIVSLGFPKRTKVDDRELYLLIDAGAASCVLQVDPDDGARVRAFATRIEAAASVVAERRVATARELAEARAELAAVREDHSAMDAARERLAEARADAPALARIAAAERELAGARERLAEVCGVGP